MGGVGFIGFYFCECLFNEGNDVICLDNYFIGSKDNICYFLDNYNFELVCYDVIIFYYVEVDEIYNLVCLVFFFYY